MKNLSKILMGPALLAIAATAGCSSETALTKSGLDPKNFETVYRGDSIALYVLTNEAGAEACITNFGGRLVSMMVPDKEATCAMWCSVSTACRPISRKTTSQTSDRRWAAMPTASTRVAS